MNIQRKLYLAIFIAFFQSYSASLADSCSSLY